MKNMSQHVIFICYYNLERYYHSNVLVFRGGCFHFCFLFHCLGFFAYLFFLFDLLFFRSIRSYRNKLNTIRPFISTMSNTTISKHVYATVQEESDKMWERTNINPL